MPLRLRRDDVVEADDEKLRGALCKPGRTQLARCALPSVFVNAHFRESENVTDSMPSSSLPRVTFLPLSTRGSEISRLYGPTVT